MGLEVVKMEEGDFYLSKEGISGNKDLWEKVCIHPLRPEEAITIFADSINTHMQPSFYFWDKGQEDQAYYTTMIGYDFGIASYVVENLVGAFIYKEHCGQSKILDSNYLMPINYKGEIEWIGPYQYQLLTEVNKVPEEKLKPIFKTSLDEKRFFERVEQRRKKFKCLYKEI